MGKLSTNGLIKGAKETIGRNNYFDVELPLWHRVPALEESMDFLDKVKKTCEKYNLLEQGDLVLVGVSGGPDSVALLDSLVLLINELNISLYVAHLNHGFRKEAEAEAQHVRILAEKYGLDIEIGQWDVPAYIRQSGMSPQEGARDIRYSFFQEIAQKVKATKIAVGHHADDQAETILFNFIRGSGLKGLGGMQARREMLIRPLIEITREEIEAYCKHRGLRTVLDSSNLKSIYTRNKIRLNLIPLLEKEFNPKLRLGLAKMGESLRDDERLINDLVKDAWNRLAVTNEKGQVRLSLTSFLGLHRSIQRRIIRCAWSAVTKDTSGPSWDHVESSLALALGKLNCRRLQLQGNIFVKKDAHHLLFQLHQEERKINSFCYSLPIPGEIIISEIGVKISTCKMSLETDTAHEDAIYLDLDRLPSDLKLRNRRVGDLWKFEGGTKKLKKLFIDLKIPREQRDSIPLLAAGQNIVWGAQVGVASPWKVTSETKNVLKINLKEL